MTLLAAVAVVGLLTGAWLLRRRRPCAWCGAPLRAGDLRDHFLSTHVHASPPLAVRRARWHAA